MRLDVSMSDSKPESTLHTKITVTRHKRNKGKTCVWKKNLFQFLDHSHFTLWGHEPCSPIPTLCWQFEHRLAELSGPSSS